MSAVPLIKIQKKTSNKIEQAKTLISVYCLLHNIKLSKSELTALAYFMVYKISESTKSLIIKSKIFANEDSLANTLSKFRKLKLLKKSDKEDIFNDALNINLEPVMAVMIKVDNK